MQNIIQLLPDAIANQIAAGEVVQRPASVIKELMENAIDAGATRVDVTLKNAGKTLIQVADNGAGMTAADARMAFERHATSKIRTQDDLYNIRTLGFRGEALASIAAVAQVHLRTRLHSEELGTELEIEASEVRRQGSCVCPPGSIFAVKNLFYNVPARRNFLKTNPVETRHTLTEFLRVALPNPHVHLTFTHNDTLVHDLVPGSLEERIIALLGQDLEGELTPVQEETGYVQISGFIGSPAVHRTIRGDQYFFVNNRFIRSGYLHHAISTVYQGFLPKDTHPFYCLFLEIDPRHIDINIHPTKTEVKFDDEQTLYALLQSVIRKGLNDLHHTPAPVRPTNEVAAAIYRSGAPENEPVGRVHLPPDRGWGDTPPARRDWDALYAPPERRDTPTLPPPPVTPPVSRDLFGQVAATQRDEPEEGFIIQYLQRYILTHRGERLLIINQHLAHQRVLYEKFLDLRKGNPWPSQHLLFPQTVALSAPDYELIRSVDSVMAEMGFEIKEFGKNTLIVYGMPSGIPTSRVRDIMDQVLADIQAAGSPQAGRRYETLARAVAVRSAVQAGQRLNTQEMQTIVRDLFRCEVPAYSPAGKPVYKEMSAQELETFFT
ncbi:MAG: DNA mismatch repair endonuclease MutL [Bacteroidia bacterium]|nr:DNA mismatch repair endonuclease MutL [Bacteroidia bacterium]